MSNTIRLFADRGWTLYLTLAILFSRQMRRPRSLRAPSPHKEGREIDFLPRIIFRNGPIDDVNQWLLLFEGGTHLFKKCDRWKREVHISYVIPFTRRYEVEQFSSDKLRSIDVLVEVLVGKFRLWKIDTGGKLGVLKRETSFKNI